MLKNNRGFLIIIFIYIILGICWIVITPYGEGPDELGHLGYIIFIAQIGKLPITQGHYYDSNYNPPLYYIIMAPLWKMLKADDPLTYTKLNPDYPGFAEKNKRTFDVSNISSRSLKAFYILRFANFPFSIAIIVLTYFICLKLFPTRRDIALSAMSIVAFNPRFHWNSGMLRCDSLASFLSTLAILLYIHIFLVKRLNFKMITLAGIIVGVALLSKKTSLFLIPLFFITCLFRNDWTLRKLISWLAIFLISCTLVQSPYMYWLHKTYGDPFGFSMYSVAFSDILERACRLERSLIAFPFSVVSSFWDNIGWAAIGSDNINILYSSFTWVAIFGILVYLADQIFRYKFPGEHKKILFLITVPLSGILIQLFSVVKYRICSGCYLFPAISAISFCIPLGIYQAIKFFVVLWRKYLNQNYVYRIKLSIVMFFVIYFFLWKNTIKDIRHTFFYISCFSIIIGISFLAKAGNQGQDEESFYPRLRGPIVSSLFVFLDAYYLFFLVYPAYHL